MDTRKVLEEPYEDENESSDEDYSTVSDEDSESTTSSDEDVDVAFLASKNTSLKEMCFKIKGLLKKASKYKLIGDVLYMKGADLVLRRVPWREELYRMSKENHEGLLPITSRGKSYILTAVDYLSRWAEAIAVKQITAKDVAKFVYDEICCKFGVPLELLSDKGPGFRAKLSDFLCTKMKIRHQHTTPYYPQCNGLNERFNGELVQILSKVIEHQGKNWDLELPSALWAYRTLVKTGTGFTPFHLVYGKQALLPVEVNFPAVKMLEKLLGPSSDAFKERLLQLQEVQLDRMSALEHYGHMQEKALEKINEKIKSKGIKKHDLVLRYNSKLDKTFQKKFQIKWEGPFKVVECFSNGTYQLANLDGVLHKSRVNGLHLKLYHARLMMVEQDELFVEQVMSMRDEETCDAASLVSLFTAADHE
ncbi:hypothetical protein L7F22_069093 [Adiantum nelumboides]|nr:hypothetical protein [Adiantum nelumboides]